MLDAEKKRHSRASRISRASYGATFGNENQMESIICIIGTVYYVFGEVSLGFLILRVLSSADSCKSFLG